MVVSRVTHRIEVRLSEHRLRVFDGDKVVVDEAVGVGRTDRPTPGGVYYLKELLQPPNPNGVYGSYAYGLSGFSNVLQEFNGGTGVIGIHGTNDPGAIGGDVSSGCIRLENDGHRALGERDRPPPRHPGGDPGVTRLRRAVAAGAMALVLLAACGSDDGAATPETTTTTTSRRRLTRSPARRPRPGGGSTRRRWRSSG